jgi:hypothetical protein
VVTGAVALAAIVAVGVPAAAQEDPPGNNGTVKVDRVLFDDVPDNEPHVGCTFQIDWYGFDAGDDLFADVTFEAIAPTGQVDPLLTDTVFIGEDDNSGGGSEDGLDASKTYDLTGALADITPHPEQGWHVKLTVHADGSQGADTKFKVFWASGCEPTSSTSSTTSTTSTSTTTPDGSTTTTVGITPGGGTPGTPGTPGGPTDPGPSSTTVPVELSSADDSLPVTGSDDRHLILLAVWLVVIGGGALVLTRRLRSQGG